MSVYRRILTSITTDRDSSQIAHDRRLNAFADAFLRPEFVRPRMRSDLVVDDLFRPHMSVPPRAGGPTSDSLRKSGFHFSRAD